MANPLGFLKDATQVLEMAYKDLAQPGIQQVGLALGNTLSLANAVTLPLKGWSEQKRMTFENNMECVRKKLEHTDESKIISVPPEIGVPIIDKFTYVSTEEISNLFANLLAKASVTDTASLGHPGFLKIIDSLSIDEAKIIQKLATNWPHGRYIPFINYRAFFTSPEGESYRYIDAPLTGIEKGLNLLFDENMGLYFQNLASLGILEFQAEGVLSPTRIYDELAELYQPSKEDMHTQLIVSEKFERIGMDRGHFTLTDYGVKFIEACF
ncbi:DUF4393 domain-containing protein [Priestia sp. SIMBA_032]|uniref:DUF4393 domain-containing protein n=1 Tax=Priestia sp. SIMBA_032 TaxID=3085775 RepID=UPI00397E4884